MKPEIHPDYQPATITCACGVVYQTRSTAGSFAVDVCGGCHPFYTGRQKLVDTAGRVEKFRAKYGLKGESAGEEVEETVEAAETPVEA